MSYNDDEELNLNIADLEEDEDLEENFNDLLDGELEEDDIADDEFKSLDEI